MTSRTCPPTVPGAIEDVAALRRQRSAGFDVRHTALSAAQVKQMAAEQPSFDTILYEDGSKAMAFPGTAVCRLPCSAGS